MHITPSGRHMGRKPDRHDPRDHHFRSQFPHLMSVSLPPRTNNAMHPGFMPVLDQGQTSSCGPNSFARWSRQWWPAFDVSRLDHYWQVRLLEGTTGEDAGVETRDLFKAAQQTGVISEAEWPYDVDKILIEPAPSPQRHPRVKIGSYSRLTTAMEVLQCLASGRTAIMGFEVPASFDDAAIAAHGVLRYPQQAEPTIGGHDVHLVDYDLDFKRSTAFKASGIDPALMSDHAVKIENSWSAEWGLGGFFWMALPWAIDVSTGNDLWTGKL